MDGGDDLGPHDGSDSENQQPPAFSIYVDDADDNNPSISLTHIEENLPVQPTPILDLELNSLNLNNSEQLDTELADLEQAQFEHQQLLKLNAEYLRRIAIVISHEKAASSAVQSAQRQSAEDPQSDPAVGSEFYRVLSSLSSLWLDIEEERDRAEQRLAVLTSKLEQSEARLNEIRQAALMFKREVGHEARDSRSGRPLPNKLLLAFEADDEQTERLLSDARLKFLILDERIRELREQLREKVHSYID